MTTKFIVSVPVVVEVENDCDLKSAWDMLRELGGTGYSCGYRVVFHSDRVKLRELRAAFEAARKK